MLKNSSLFEIETATSEQEADSNFGIAIQVAHPDEIAALQKALLARTRFRRMAASPPFIEPPEIFRLAVKPAGFVTERGVLVNSLRNEMDWSTSMEIGWKAAGDRAVKAIAQPSPKEIGATCDKIESILTTHFQDAKLFWHDEGSVLLGEIGDELEERGGLLMMQDIYMHLLDRPIRKNLDVLEFAWRLSFSKLCVKPGYSL